MSEPNNNALVPVAPPPALTSDGRTNPAYLDHLAAGVDARIAERPSSISADQLPNSFARTNVQTTGRQELWPGESKTPSLTADGKISDKWMDAMIANLPNNQARRTPSQEPQFGYDDQVVAHNLSLIENLIGAPEQGAPRFLWALYDAAPDAFNHLVKTIVFQYAPDYGEWTVTDEEAQRLRGEWREAEQAGGELFESVFTQHRAGVLADMRRWQPRKATNETEADRLRLAALEGAFSELMSDPEHAQMYDDAKFLLINAHCRGYLGYEDEKAEYEAQGRELAAQFVKALGHAVNGYIQLLDR